MFGSEGEKYKKLIETLSQHKNPNYKIKNITSTKNINLFVTPPDISPSDEHNAPTSWKYTNIEQISPILSVPIEEPELIYSTNKSQKYGDSVSYNDNVSCDEHKNELQNNIIILSGECKDVSHKNIILDNSYPNSRLVLDNNHKHHIVKIYLKYVNNNIAYVECPIGILILDSHNTKIKLMYIDNKYNWITIGNKHTDFYPRNEYHLLHNKLCHSSFGSSVAMSGNGNVCAIGSYTLNNCVGGCSVFERTKGTFNETCKLYGISNIGISCQGISISLNFDGSLIAIGGSRDNNQVGACWIFRKSENNWIFAKKLIGSGYKGIPFEGRTVKITPNGNYIFISGIHDNICGSVWIFDYKYNEISKICGEQSDDKFGLFILTNSDGSLFVISSTTHIRLYANYNNKINCIANIYDGISINSISSSLSFKYFLISDNNVLKLYKLKSTKLKLVHVFEKQTDVRKILCCDISMNGQTIIVCYETEKETKFSCIHKYNHRYEIVFDNIISGKQKNYLNCVISSDGKYALIGDESENDFDGICYCYY